MVTAVRDSMHVGVFSCLRETPIQAVAQALTEHNVSALVVLDDQGALAGLISRSDLVNARLYEQYWKHWRGLTAGQIMTTTVITVSPDDTMEHASRLLAEQKIGRLVVVEAGAAGLIPVGVLSLTDVVRSLSQDE